MRICIPVACLFIAAGPLMAQDSAHVPSPAESQFRDPTKAAVLGTLIPGAGQIYATDYLNGVRTYLGTIGSIGFGALVYEAGWCSFTPLDPKCKPGPQWARRTLGSIVIGVGVAAWARGAIDAPSAARRANEEHRRRAQIQPFVAPSEANRTNVGVSVTW